MHLALAGGTFVSRPFAADERAGDEDLDRKEPRFSATYNSFDVHCAVRVEAGDDERRERLVRYCARPPFALERMSSGTAATYGTYLGGSAGDGTYGVAIDSNGNAFVAGTTQSSDFPVFAAAQPSFGGSQDGFLVKIKNP